MVSPSRLIPFAALFPLLAFGQTSFDGDGFRPAPREAPAESGSDVVTTLGFEGQGHRAGVTLGATALVEGPHWGVGAEYQAIVSGAAASLRQVTAPRPRRPA